MTTRSLRSFSRVLCAALFCALSTASLAQATLGELLDAGARQLTGEEFRNEVVGHALVGPLPTGGELDVLYIANGRIAGRGNSPNYSSAYVGTAVIDGDWRIDDGGRVCATMHLFISAGRAQSFPPRCQYWFKSADAFYLADSDSDRRAKVLRRTIKK